MGGRKPTEMSMPEGVSDEYLAQHSTLSHCVVCERPMRPPGAKAEDWPATVAWGTSTQCKTCYNRSYSKPVSAGDALRIKDGRKNKVRKVVNRQGKRQEVTGLQLTRLEASERWSEEDRSAALKVCDHEGDPVAAAEILDMIGLFDGERMMISNAELVNFRAPKDTFRGS